MNNLRNLVSIHLFFIFFTLLFISCSQQNEQETQQRNNSSNIDVSLKTDTLRISLDSVTSNIIPVYFAYSEKNKQYLVTYNPRKPALDVFDLDTKEYQRSISLAQEGPDGVGRVQSLFVENWDNIFVFSIGRIHVLNQEGKIKQSINLSEVKPKKSSDKIYTLMADKLFCDIYYDASTQKVYLYNTEVGKYIPELDVNLVANIDLKSKEVALLPITFSDYVKENDGKFIFFWYMNILFNGNKIISNSPTESNIYLFDVDTKTNKTFEAKSKFTKNTMSAYNGKEDDMEQSDAFLLENPVFFKPLHDPYRKLYYRFHWGETSVRNTQSQKNELIDKPMYLMIFDESFNILKEIELPKDTYGPYEWFVSKEGLYINARHPKYKNAQEGVLELHLIKVNPS